MDQRKLYRSRSNKMIAGVCGGIAEYLGIDPTVVRLAAVALLLLGFGTVGLVYLIMMIVVPEEPFAGTPDASYKGGTAGSDDVPPPPPADPVAPPAPGSPYATPAPPAYVPPAADEWRDRRSPGARAGVGEPRVTPPASASTGWPHTSGTETVQSPQPAPPVQPGPPDAEPAGEHGPAQS